MGHTPTFTALYEIIQGIRIISETSEKVKWKYPQP